MDHTENCDVISVDFGRGSTRPSYAMRQFMDENAKPVDEPTILSIERYLNLDPPGRDPRPERSEHEDGPHSEKYWAGRNLAMRRSARWAA